MGYIITKYKPQPCYFKSRLSILDIMIERGYRLMHEIEITDEKNHIQIVKNYLELVKASEDNFYVWHVHYPRQLGDYKRIEIFTKKIRI